MKKLHFNITALEPLIITQHSDDPNMYETLQYIRGTVIQGIFAQKYLKDINKTADEHFTRLIVSGDCIFSNAYPTFEDKLYFPAPYSVVRKKYPPKKNSSDDQEKTEPAVNLLLPHDEEQTKGINSLVFIEGNQISPLTIRKEIRLHNQIDDLTRTSESGILFNYQSLPAGLVFKGSVTIKDDSDEVELKKIFAGETILRIGRSATSEYGKVRFEWINSSKEEKLPVSDKVIMTLLSDTIIYNENGFSSISVNDINKYVEGGMVAGSISRKSRIEGFLNVWKLRKPSENVFAAGSSFLLDKLPDNSNELVNFGIGERTHEGYGQVSFSFQKVVTSKLVYKEWEEPKIQRPIVMRGLTYEILKSVQLNRIKEALTKVALEEANKTRQIPTNHLLGKLKNMAEDLSSLVRSISELKDIAQNQLRKAHIGNRTLFDHLKERAENIENICNLTYQCGDTIIDLTGSKPEITKLYLEQYLNQLRRRNKKTEQ